MRRWAHDETRPPSLSRTLSRSPQSSLFCGRLPKGFSLAALQAAASSPPPSSGGARYLPVLGASHCRATCVFLEFADAAAVAYASSYMNGSLFSGTNIIAVPVGR